MLFLMTNSFFQRYTKQKIFPRSCPKSEYDASNVSHIKLIREEKEIKKFLKKLSHIAIHTFPSETRIEGTNTTNKILYTWSGSLTLSLAGHEVEIREGKKFNLPRVGFPLNIRVGKKKLTLVELSDKENNDLSSIRNLWFDNISTEHKITPFYFTENFAPLNSIALNKFTAPDSFIQMTKGITETLVIYGRVKTYWAKNGRHKGAIIYGTGDIIRSPQKVGSIYGIKNIHKTCRRPTKTVTLSTIVQKPDAPLSPALLKKLTSRRTA